MLPKSKILYFGFFLFLILNAVEAKPSKDTEGKVETNDEKKKGE